MHADTDTQLLSRLLGGFGLTIGGFRSLVRKASPGYGEVHVSTAGAEQPLRRVRKASGLEDPNPPLNNQDVQLAQEALYPEEQDDLGDTEEQDDWGDTEEVSKGGPGSGPQGGPHEKEKEKKGPKDPRHMTPGELKKESAKLSEKQSKLNDKLIEAGHGTLTYPEMHARANENPLFAQSKALGERHRDLHDEAARRGGPGFRIHQLTSIHRAEKVSKAAGEPRRIASVAIRHGDHLLMGKRRDNGKWTVPGGHLDPGESYEDGAHREVEEESGVTFNEGELSPLTDVHMVAEGLHVQPFVANLKERPSTTMKEDPDAEVHRWQWVDVSDGLPEHIAGNLHVPLERNVLMDALGLAGDGDEDDGVLLLDLGSGTEREPDHVGVDLYPYDDETLVHDLNLGIPFEDGSAAHVNLRNALHDMELDDRDGLLAEICRVLADGGTCSYEGPEALDMPEGMDEAEHSQGVVEGASAEWHKQTFVRNAVTAEQVTKGGPGSGPQGGQGHKSTEDHERHVKETKDAADKARAKSGEAGRHYDKSVGTKDAASAHEASSQASQEHREALKAHIAALEAYQAHLKSKSTEKVKKSRTNAGKITQGVRVPFAKKSPVKQIVYCVVLAPNESDEHEDYMLAEDIEEVAHLYMLESRVVGAEHTKTIKAAPVESYIMPMDMVWEGPAGEPQKVKKGSWIIAIKIHDKREWERCLDGTYNSVSLSGSGVRDDMRPETVKKDGGDNVPDTSSSLEGTLPVPIE